MESVEVRRKSTGTKRGGLCQPSGKRGVLSVSCII